jgi:deoxyadenosine/deoxycytidine kinase
MLHKTILTLASSLIFFVSIAPSLQAFDIDQVKHEITQELSSKLKGNPQDKPILLLIGGYPGAGKTTLIQALSEKHGFAVISFNDIRQSLVDRKIRGVKGSPYDWEIIVAVNRNLFRMCFEHRLHVAIDTNAHVNNIQLFEELLEEEHYRDTYQIVKICLNPPPDVLFSRIRARVQKEGVHQGTEEDLFNDLNSVNKKIRVDDYSLIIKNDATIPFEMELEIMNAFLKPYLD